MRSALLATALAAIQAAAANQPQTKAPDACTPPPAGVAPSLPARLLEGQGSTPFPITTTNPQAQAFFNQGVAQMHSFWAREAERSFLQAAALDPEAPMPHWGIAMVAAGDYRPRFQLEHYQYTTVRRAPSPQSRAIAAAQRALELSARPGKATELEKLYIAAVAARRDLRSKDPDQAYIDHLRALLAKYPKEIEARCYLALHLMRGFDLPSKTPRPGGTMEAVGILRDLLQEAPDHPGVHHYVIHGWEGSRFAAEAWPSCRRYAELAPNIPHALHMPGHIYSQTGKWSEAVQAFSDAAVNERKWMAADALYGNSHHGHNVHYLATALSYSGEYDRALESARELLRIRENPREAAAVDNTQSAYRQGWFALMRTLVQAERWDTLLDGATLPESDRPRLRAWRHWALGVAQAAKGNVEAARGQAAQLESALAALTRQAKIPEPPELSIARQELQGHILMASGRTEPGLRRLEQAARRELALRYAEPPLYPRPVLEALGRAYLRHGKLPLAEKAFRSALEQNPESYVPRTGLREVLSRLHRALEAGAGL